VQTLVGVYKGALVYVLHSGPIQSRLEVSRIEVNRIGLSRIEVNRIEVRYLHSGPIQSGQAARALQRQS
jgi:hypothetical protein